MFSKATIALVAALTAVPVLAQSASPTQLATVKAQFQSALLVPSVVPAFNPLALLNVTFPSVGLISTGQAVDKDQAGAKPTITVVGTNSSFASGSLFSQNNKYTMIMIDGDVPGATNPKGVNCHYLQNDFSYGALTNNVLTFTNSTPAVINYAGPGPAAGSGPHRYTLLIFEQQAAFKAPATPASGSSVTMIDFPSYVQSAGLSAPLAGNYFTVEVGAATVTFSSTTAVNPATLSVASATGTATGSSASASGTGAAGSQNGAMTTAVNGFFATALAVAMGMFFA